MRALVISADPDEEVYLTALPDTDRLSALQEMVGGNIEGVPLLDHDDKLTAYCSEEGKILVPPLPANHFATVFLAGYGFPTDSDILNGQVVVVGPLSEEGDDTDVPQEVVNTCLSALATFGRRGRIRDDTRPGHYYVHTEPL